MTANEVKKLLGLQPHPQEGGWYVRTYEASEMISAAEFRDGRYPGPRRTGTAIYYLLEPETFSEMHRLKRRRDLPLLCRGCSGDVAAFPGRDREARCDWQ